MVTGSSFPRPLLLKHESLFKWEGTYHDNAHIHKYQIYQCDLYAIEYKYAADLAIEFGLEKSSIDFEKYHSLYRAVDVLVWPTVFLYRQYLELRLKAIIIRGSMLESCEKDDYPDNEDMQFKIKHEIDDLWRNCRTVIEKLHFDADAEDLKELEIMDKYIEEFSKLDNNSYIFRYPVNKDKRPWDYEKHQFSLKNLKNIMDKIYLYLENQNSSLDGSIEYEEECIREGYP